MKTIRHILSFIYAFFIVIGFGFIGLIIYIDVVAPWRYMIFGSIVILSFFIARLVYTVTLKRGPISMLAGNHSSYDMDDLVPSLGHGVKQIHPNDLDEFISSEGLELKNCSVAIWGDWQERKLEFKHEIDSTSYNPEKGILTLSFKNKCLLKVRNPTLIHSSSSYLKIFNAKEVLWQIEDAGQIKKFSYLNTGKDIKTTSNTNWIPHSEDLGIGMHAVYLQS